MTELDEQLAKLFKISLDIKAIMEDVLLRQNELEGMVRCVEGEINDLCDALLEDDENNGENDA